MGVKFRHADVSPGFVSLLCVCKEDPETEEAIVDDVKFVQLTHTRVLPLLKPGETLPEPFVAEAICPLKRAASFSIADGQPRMLVGSVIFVANKPKLAVAQAIRLMHPEEECKFFHDERNGWWELLQKVTPAKKRKVEDLVMHTPSKKQWPGITQLK